MAKGWTEWGNNDLVWDETPSQKTRRRRKFQNRINSMSVNDDLFALKREGENLYDIQQRYNAQLLANKDKIKSKALKKQIKRLLKEQEKGEKDERTSTV